MSSWNAARTVPHTVQVNMKSSGYDLSRAVRSDRYKLIYNMYTLDPLLACRFRKWCRMEADGCRK